MLKQIINAKILTPQGWLKNGSVIINDNKILEVSNCDLAVVGANIGGIPELMHTMLAYSFPGIFRILLTIIFLGKQQNIMYANPFTLC